MFCRYCGSTISDSAAFCRRCGKPVAKNQPAPASQSPLCPNCGGAVSPTAVFCRNCGGRLTPSLGAQPASAAPVRVKRYGWLRALLIAACVVLVGVGVWKIPGNLRAAFTSGGSSGTEAGPGESEEIAHAAKPLTEEQSAEYARIDAAYEGGAPAGAAEKADPHPEYRWLFGDESGWEIGDGEEEAEE